MFYHPPVIIIHNINHYLIRDKNCRPNIWLFYVFALGQVSFFAIADFFIVRSPLEGIHLFFSARDDLEDMPLMMLMQNAIFFSFMLMSFVILTMYHLWLSIALINDRSLDVEL